MTIAIERTDPHHEQALIPEDYEYVATVDRRTYTVTEAYQAAPGCVQYYQKPVWFARKGVFALDPQDYELRMPDGKTLREALRKVEDPYEGHYALSGHCDFCGNSVWLDGALFRHAPTGQLVVVGGTCAGQFCSTTHELAVRNAKKYAQSLRTKARNAGRHAGYPDELKLYLADNPGVFAALWYGFEILERSRARTAEDGGYEAKKSFVADVTDRCFEQAYLPTDGQAAGMLASMRSFYLRQLQRSAPRDDGAEKEPCPTEKGLRVRGRVVSVKEVADPYSYDQGTVFKMLVEDRRGFRVFGTVPRAIEVDWPTEVVGEGTPHHICKGDEVEFVANVERSDRDALFGFFKRPRKATIVAWAWNHYEGSSTGQPADERDNRY